ncbi:MAG TPA: response regulator, partial [Rhodanobacteraceae bacterium]|nr:response regulator [Rhodanobacteraceae bacterium]
MQKHILIVEDEPAIRDMVAFALRKAGMEAAHAADARGAQSMIAERVPDLILLDWMLPGMSGLELARRLRKEDLTRDVPIIMLTARGEETDRVGGLEAGVDDYVVKPFSPRELIARINAVMRRTHGVDGDGVVSIGALRIDSGAHRVYASVRQAPKSLEGNAAPTEAAGDAIVPIGPTEYRLLHFFMTHAERVY